MEALIFFRKLYNMSKTTFLHKKTLAHKHLHNTIKKEDQS